MAQYKVGLEYYAHNVGMSSDRRLIKIRREYGSVGIDVWFALLDMIYSQMGYYLIYNDKTADELLWDIAGLVRGKDAPDEHTIAMIIDSLVEVELFDTELFRQGVLTSVQIQEQFYMSTLRRKHAEVKKEYWLLSINRMKGLSEKSPIFDFFMSDNSNVDILASNVDIKEQNVDILEQSKVKKSKAKQNESKEKNIESKAEQSKQLRSADFFGCADSACAAAQNIDKDVCYCSDKSGAPTAEDTENADNTPAQAVDNSPEGIRARLISEYGRTILHRYEEKFRKWVQNSGAKHAEMYSQIEKWLCEDIGYSPPKTAGKASAYDDETEELLKSIMEKYGVTG